MAERHLSNPLGSYPDRVEYQVGRTIVWVVTPQNANRSKCVDVANQAFEDIWNVIPEVLKCASAFSRVELPEFWRAHDDAGTADQQLSVWGIWIYPDEGTVDYEVGCNHDFDRDESVQLPDLPTTYSVMVTRDHQGNLRAC